MDDDAEITNPDVMQKVLNLYNKYKSENLAIIGFLGKNPFTGKTETPLKNPDLIKDKNELFYNLFFGYGHVFPKTLIEETGFYQDDFFYGMEEYDLSYATIKQGYSILFTKDILVLHKQNPDGREPGKTTYARMFENKMIVAFKHLPMLYVCSHFILWSSFLIWKSKFDIGLYFKSLIKLNQRIKNATRLKMNRNGMQYLKNVGARLWY
jgi:GT2 family glycosyltransferase